MMQRDAKPVVLRRQQSPGNGGAYPDRAVDHRPETTVADGNLIATEDNLGRITRTYYDELNRPVTVVHSLTAQTPDVLTPPDRSTTTSSANLRTDTTYDTNGNAIATTAPSGMITRTYYDSLNRPETVVRNLAGFLETCQV